jgi:16S rRNA (guanine1207-N2)-methyltransferase
MTVAAGALTFLQHEARYPCLIILGSPGEAAQLCDALNAPATTCFQMDLYQAARLQDDLASMALPARVVTSADLWDLGSSFESAIYPVPRGGERHLKIDMVEQAFHVLRPRGVLFVLAAHETDLLFPPLLKKVFGRVHQVAADQTPIYWCRRQGERSKRRHEVIFQARMPDGVSLRFLSRPGVFAYGCFDAGARALLETMTIAAGDRIVDIGCGSGTNGIWAGRLAGPAGHVTFVDSNLRALALAEHNARSNGLSAFDTCASGQVLGPPEYSFDVALANPPYYAQLTIAQLFIERARVLLRPGGRLFLVTKQPHQLKPVVTDWFGTASTVERRGYVVLCAGAG